MGRSEDMLQHGSNWLLVTVTVTKATRVPETPEQRLHYITLVLRSLSLKGFARERTVHPTATA